MKGASWLTDEMNPPITSSPTERHVKHIITHRAKNLLHNGNKGLDLPPCGGDA